MKSFLVGIAITLAVVAAIAVDGQQIIESNKLHKEAITFATATITSMKTDVSAVRDENKDLSAGVDAIAQVLNNQGSKLIELDRKVSELEKSKCKCGNINVASATLVSEVKKEPWSVTMYTSDTCPPCKRWLANEKNKVTRAGWRFNLIEATEGLTPRFVLKFKGKTVEHIGYLDMQTMKRIVEGE